MLKSVLILFIVLSACSLHGQETYLLDSVTTVILSSGSSGNVTFEKLYYDDSCRLAQHKTDTYTTTYSYDKNTITIDIANTFNSMHLNTTVEHYSDFDSILTSVRTNVLGVSNIDSFFYNEDHKLIRKKKYKFDDGVQYLNTDSKLTYVNGWIETDSILIYNSGGFNTYFENNSYAYDQDGNEVLHLYSDNYSFSTINKDSIISIFVDGRITAKHQYIFYDNQLISESKWETSYSGEYTSIYLSNRFDQDDPYSYIQKVKFHHVDEPIYDYDTAWLYGESNENVEFIFSRLIQSWDYNDAKDTMEIRQFQQHFDVNQNVTFTTSTRKQYFKKQSQLADEGNKEEHEFSNYPNPSTSQQIISIESNQVFDEVTIYNELGQIVFRAKLELSNQYSLSENLQAGIYFMRLGKEGQYHEKVNKHIIIK